MEQYIHFITQHLYLWGGAVFIVILLLLLEFEAKWQGIRRVGAAELSLLMNRGGIVIDVNEADAFATGHILNAIHLPLSGWAQKVPQLDKHKAEWLILTASQERQALHAAKMLKQQGFEKVGILAGGLAAWREANLPLVKK